MYCGYPHCAGKDHWSHMDCGKKEPHSPHVWTSQFVLYGPYLCLAGQQTLPLEDQ